MTNRITELFQIEYPLIQAGMIWNSGWRLASAASNAGALGLIGAGSMYPNVLREHIQKCKQATDKPFGVNVPMLYPNIEEIMVLTMYCSFLVLSCSLKTKFRFTTVMELWCSKKTVISTIGTSIWSLICSKF